jgi:hypothetical protein
MTLMQVLHAAALRLTDCRRHLVDAGDLDPCAAEPWATTSYALRASSTTAVFFRPRTSSASEVVAGHDGHRLARPGDSHPDGVTGSDAQWDAGPLGEGRQFTGAGGGRVRRRRRGAERPGEGALVTGPIEAARGRRGRAMVSGSVTGTVR